ncbi:Ferredoxin-NADP reductase [Nakamurella panacisegetis]|uniref:Ferredoxin-NADP reductase n=1 Tax=Nakamurella panacisegetis TaxID=1090615 RepID=A0A1H0N705_9ACTN|nr:hybrid-cluster NAD(P)-dependent oxidoreductase [Nakamurella panacisegetis]SDO88401.1 Ferredoxin-NADP reductase [Nakamurella panacisegetis]
MSLPVWDPDRDDVLVCRAVRTVTATVKTFVLAARTPQRFSFRGGQHLVFAFDIDGAEVLRSYTLSSPPTRPETISITVRRRPGGVVSTWLHDHLRPGMTVRAISDPLGEFTMEDHPAAKYLMLAGGSGITPFLAMLRALHDGGRAHDIVLVHAAHTPDDLIQRAELALLTAETTGLRTVLVPSHDDDGWPGYRGRVSAGLLTHIAPDLAERVVLTCGPESFMSDLQHELIALGCDPGDLHRESFTFADPAVALQRQDADPAEHLADAGFPIEFAHLGRTVHSPPGSTVLQAAAAAGITLPSSCSQGLCGTCKSRLVSGQVDMQHAGGIRPKEIAQGRFLPCCSVPLSALVVDRL